MLSIIRIDVPTDSSYILVPIGEGTQLASRRLATAVCVEIPEEGRRIPTSHFRAGVFSDASRAMSIADGCHPYPRPKINILRSMPIKIINRIRASSVFVDDRRRAQQRR